MSKMFTHKGFYGSIEFSLDDMILHGKIECINDVVTYEAETMEGLKLAFAEAVEDYLETCAEIGKEPEKSMSGHFNIRIGESLHKKAFLQSRIEGVSLNELIRLAVEEKLSAKKEYHFHFERKTEKFSRRFDYETRANETSSWSGSAIAMRVNH